MESLLHIENTAVSARSKWITIAFASWILLIDFLFYDEGMGLNALLASIVTIPTLGLLNKDVLKNPKWWLIAITWLLTAFGVFLKGTFVSGFFFTLTFFVFVAITNRIRFSLPMGILNSFVSFSFGLFLLPQHFFDYLRKPGNNKNKWLLNILMVTIPFIIIIVFFKLYQSADQEFYELTKFINLDWISWGFIMTYFLLTFLLYGFFFYNTQEHLFELENKAKNDISPNYTDRIQNFFGVKNEVKIALIALTALNAMLLLYNILDVKFISTNLNSSHFSETVHHGINALITSIILVILLTTYLLRGQLNFAGNKGVKALVLIWLFQNIFMVATTMIKNYGYVDNYGLTHKRIGVFVYLFLAIVGIVLTIYKVYSKRTFWFLLRQGSISFVFILSTLQTFNWHRLIASYNLHNVQEEKIEYDYLLGLGRDTYPFILQHQQETGKVPQDVLDRLDESAPLVIEELQKKEKKYSWKSMNVSDYILLRELEQYDFEPYQYTRR